MGCFASRAIQANEDRNLSTPNENEAQTPPANGAEGPIQDENGDAGQNGGSRRPAPAATPKVQHTKTVKSVVNLRKKSLKVLPDEANEGQYKIQFIADSSVPCKAYFYIMAYEKESAQKDAPPELKSKHSDYEPSFSVDLFGLDQSFTSPLGLPLGLFSEEELTVESPGPHTAYPIAIRLQPLDDKGDPNLKQSQTTLASLVKQPDDSYGVNVLKQLLWVDGTSYVLHEIYGGLGKDGVSNEAVDSMSDLDGKECVVCLSEFRNTLAIPCRHMCLCSGCAKTLRHQTNKCPMCRAAVVSFLEIKYSDEAKKAKAVETEESEAVQE